MKILSCVLCFLLLAIPILQAEETAPAKTAEKAQSKGTPQFPTTQKLISREKILDSAKRIALISKKDGKKGTQGAINGCYEQYVIKKNELTDDYKHCLIQDIVYSHVVAGFHKKSGRSEDFARVMKGAQARFSMSIQQVKVGQKDAQAIVNDAVKIGVPLFMKLRFDEKDKAPK